MLLSLIQSFSNKRRGASGDMNWGHWVHFSTNLSSQQLAACLCVCKCECVCLSVYVYTVYGLLPHQWISALLNVTPLDGEKNLVLSNSMLLWQLPHSATLSTISCFLPFSFIWFHSCPFFLTNTSFLSYSLIYSGKKWTHTQIRHNTSRDISLRHYNRNELQWVRTCIQEKGNTVNSRKTLFLCI